MELKITDISGKNYTFRNMILEIDAIKCSKTYTALSNEFDIYDNVNKKHINIFVNDIVVILKLYTIDDTILKNKAHYEDKEYKKMLYYMLNKVYC